MQLLRNHFVYTIIIFFVIATPLSTTDQYTTLAVNWTFPEGTYFEYKIQFRHLEFLNSSRIDTPAETPGFQNGTFRIDAISVQSDDFVLTDISLTIQDLYLSVKQVLYNPNSFQIKSSDGLVDIGYFALWLDFDSSQLVSDFTTARIDSLGFTSTGTLDGLTNLNMGVFGGQQVQKVGVSLEHTDRWYNWTSFYDTDTNILLRQEGEPSDPFILCFHGIKTIDFVINLIDTNYDVGPSVGSYNNTNGIYPQSDSTWIIWIFIFSGGVVFSGMMIRFRYQNRRSKKQILKERRRKQKKRKWG